MNHKFVAIAGSFTICSKCSRDIVAHSDFATCEVCKKSPTKVDLFEDYLMCAGCIASENEAKIENRSIPKELPEPIARVENEFKANGNGKDKRDFSLVDLPTNGTEFFNAETEAHVKLFEKIKNDNDIKPEDKWMFYVDQLQKRRSHLQAVLKEAVDILTETRSRLSSADRDINLVASKLRQDEKAKLKIADISYKPPTPPKKVTAPTTEKNKVVIGLAKTMYAPRDKDNKIMWETLTDEQREAALVQARLLFAGNMTSINTAVKLVNEDK
jgi:hypothetical protein